MCLFVWMVCVYVCMCVCTTHVLSEHGLGGGVDGGRLQLHKLPPGDVVYNLRGRSRHTHIHKASRTCTFEHTYIRHDRPWHTHTHTQNTHTTNSQQHTQNTRTDSTHPPDGLDDGARVDGTGGGARKHWGEEKVIARRDDNNC